MKYASRKFIDLIQNASSKWANWDPPKVIEVGDYGTINKETGEFEWEGNIYKPHFQQLLKASNHGPVLASASDADLLDLPGPILGGGEDKLIIQSSSVRTRVIKIDPEVDLQAVISVSLKIELEFQNDKTGAALIMTKPQYTSLPKDERIVDLLKSVPDTFRGKAFVTETISCPAYMMHLSDMSGHTFSISLSAKAPTLPGVAVGGEVALEWSTEAISGISRHGSNSKAIFVPLFKLKTPRPSFFRFRTRSDGPMHKKLEDEIDNWEDVLPNWYPLDEEGEEEEIIDDNGFGTAIV